MTLNHPLFVLKWVTIPKIVFTIGCTQLLSTKQMGKAQNGINLARNGW